MQSINLYNAAIYARASKDDVSSSTIDNQFELIEDYVKSRHEIKIVSKRYDNGFSGVDFLRPSFIEMMKDINTGSINCVIVKDLSRLGRNYIEVGELMEYIFPSLNIRLISINDNYDSLNPNSDAEDIIIPFKNLINEQYLRDFSIKIRSNLDVKRRNGEFVSAFAPYGYKRDSCNKHRLIVDEHAADIVRDIFKWKIKGMSQQNIADRLNEVGEPSPFEYKKKQGSKFTTVFQTNARSLWSAVAVARILQNSVYIGSLVQGKETTSSYKVKKRIRKPTSEWCVISNTHEAIIDKSDFETVKLILQQDTRISPRNKKIFPLSGLLYCADCQNSIIRKKVSKYFYYVCATNKSGKGCTSHSIKPSELEDAVMKSITQQILALFEIENSLDYLKSLPCKQENIMRITAQIYDREREIEECERYKQFLCEDYAKGDISREDFIEFGKDYAERINELKLATKKLKQESDLLIYSGNLTHENIEDFKIYNNITELSRQLVVNLIERIDIFEDKKITIYLRYQDRIGITKESSKNKDCSSNSDNNL